MLPKIISLISIVALLAWMTYFFMGCLPLLILKHDDPQDSQLVRGFFNVHYFALIGIATVGSSSAALADRRFLALVIAAIVLFGIAARLLLVPRMDKLRGAMGATDAPLIKAFRRLHLTGIMLNVLLLAGFLSALSLASAEIVSCQNIPPGCQGDACRVQCSLL